MNKVRIIEILQSYFKESHLTLNSCISGYLNKGFRYATKKNNNNGRVRCVENKRKDYEQIREKGQSILQLTIDMDNDAPVLRGHDTYRRIVGVSTRFFLSPG